MQRAKSTNAMRFKTIKRLLSVFLATLLLCGSFAVGVRAADDDDITAAFTDANFKAYVLQNFDINDDGKIQKSEVENVTRVYVSNKQIASLAGIEYFTALELLSCSSNQLTALDVSKNMALEWLYCSDNQLTSLDVSKNTALVGLRCGENKLAALEVSKNTALKLLYCYNNQLTTLDVSKNTALTHLRCDGNQLTALDVSKNTDLTYLDCYFNRLTVLDVSKNTALVGLSCGYNRLTALDVSKNTALKGLDCSDNQLTALDVSKNTKLQYLDCRMNWLKSEDRVPGLAEVRARGGIVWFSPQRYNCFKLWGKSTTWEKTPLNWFLLIVCFGWIWMAF
ncbi:MAG: hypothetical protein LBG83_01805 [Oscillospiraceae bacterium]|jgi:Leucine-rich repeat (LRR) protein|nr:hypothetical protein [Oscillospiraceae bacterium]